LAFIPLPGCDFALFEPSGALLTNGSAGLLRWPVQGDPAAPGILRVGPPQQLAVPGPICHIACSSNGRVIAVSQFQNGRVLHADHPDHPVLLGRHDDARDVAVSPDGRWVVTATQTRTGAKIWDARDGRFVKELPVDSTLIGFSPDGKWLATTGGGLRLWSVGSWQEGLKVGGHHFAFSPDSKMLAVSDGLGTVRLLDPETGTEYARLEDPNRDRVWHMSFSPDGTRLVATNDDSQSIHVWDLRTIREQLAKMDLDWDLPSYPPAAEADKIPCVQVDLGNLAAMIQVQDSYRQANGYILSKQWEKAIAAYSKAIELDPKFAGAPNGLAWLLATCPDAPYRDPTRAVELATRAFGLTPLEGNAWNTLGVAHYRAGDWKAAVAELTRSNELLGGEELSFNAFFLAMAHWQLGQQDEARKWYDRAVPWMEKHKPRDEELGRFRTEAAELLGINEKKN
jgi:Tetratricopeptide repeat/WD domain, G-beta repeat